MRVCSVASACGLVWVSLFFLPVGGACYGLSTVPGSTASSRPSPFVFLLAFALGPTVQVPPRLAPCLPWHPGASLSPGPHLFTLSLPGASLNLLRGSSLLFFSVRPFCLVSLSLLRGRQKEKKEKPPLYRFGPYRMLCISSPSLFIGPVF